MSLSLCRGRGLRAQPQFVEAGRGKFRKMKLLNIHMASVRQDCPHGGLEEIFSRPDRKVWVAGKGLLDPFDMCLEVDHGADRRDLP